MMTVEPSIENCEKSTRRTLTRGEFQLLHLEIRAEEFGQELRYTFKAVSLITS